LSQLRMMRCWPQVLTFLWPSRGHGFANQMFVCLWSEVFALLAWFGWGLRRSSLVGVLSVRWNSNTRKGITVTFAFV
jgi:hypothetical protein